MMFLVTRFHEGPSLLDECVVDVPGHPAEPAIAVGEAGTAHPVQDVQDVFTIVEAVQEGRERSQVHEVGAEPQKMA